ncbi:radical SAM protein [Patescibacteria group bacterium]
MYNLKEVVVEVTKRCNLSCIHCGSDCNDQMLKNELQLEEWKSVILQFFEMGVEKIVFSGGEPTLKVDFEKILLFASELGIKVGFISNGLFSFSESLKNAIVKADPFAVGLSIDGVKNTHNKIRRNKNSWSGLMRNISTLQEMNVQICAVTTLNKLNYRELPQLAEFLSLAGVDSWQIQLAMPSGRMKRHFDLLISEENFKDVCNQILSLRHRFLGLNIQSADCFGLAPENSIRSHCWSGCSAGISSMGMDSCGRIMPCLSIQEGGKYESIRERSVAEIWEDSEAFNLNRRFSKSDVKGECKSCDFLGECRGGCASQSFSYYGYFHSSPFCFFRSFFCKHNKE